MGPFNPVNDVNRQMTRRVEEVERSLSKLISSLIELRCVVKAQQQGTYTAAQLAQCIVADRMQRGFYAHDIAELGAKLGEIGGLADALEMLTHPNAVIPQEEVR